MLVKAWQEMKKINLFGRTFQFENDFSSRSNSIQNLSLTVILVIATIVVGFIFGKEIYLRENPKYTSSKITISKEESLVNFLDFPVIFKFLDNVGSPLEDDIVKKMISVNLITFDIVEGNGQKSNFMPIKICDLENYKNSTKFEMVKNIIDSKGVSYCLNVNEQMMNKKAAFDSKNILLIFNKCKTNCLNNLDDFLEGAYVGLNYIDNYVNPSSYNDPIKSDEKIEMIKISSKISKELAISFQNNILKTNKGWIFEDFIEQNYVSYDTLISEVFISQNELIRMFIDSPTFVALNVREYMKIQDLLASIGGFFNAIYMIMTFLTYHYISFEYYLSIYELFHDNKLYNDEDKNEEMVKDRIVTTIKRNNFVSQENLKSEESKKEKSENNNSHSKINKDKNYTSNLKKLNQKIKRSEENDGSEGNERKDRHTNNEKENQSVDEKEKSSGKIKQVKEQSYPLPSLEHTNYYIIYIYNRFFCCRNYNKKMYEFCSNLLSFDYYLKQTKHNQDFFKQIE